MQDIKAIISKQVSAQFKFEHDLEVEWFDVQEFARRHDMKGVYGALGRIIKLHKQNRNESKKRSFK